MTDAATPQFSVIVPTFDRLEALDRCLGALAAQDIARERFEVVVVNDGGAVSPRTVVDRHRHALDVHLFEQVNAGPAAARNAGAAAARGEYLVFTDDDCLPEQGWLSALARSAARDPGLAIGGRVVSLPDHGIYSHASQSLIDFLYSYYNAPGEHGRFFITSNLAFPAARFREVGGFDVTFPLAAAEDRDLCDRWREQGGVIVYDDQAIVRHSHALDLRSFCRQHLNYGRGAYYLHRARERRGVAPIRLETDRFYSRLVAHPLDQGTGARAAALSALLFTSQVAYLAGYVLERVMLTRRRAGAPS